MTKYDDWKLDNGDDGKDCTCEDCGEPITSRSKTCRGCGLSRKAEEDFDRWHDEHD
jgi:hypothetical protein